MRLSALWPQNNLLNTNMKSICSLVTLFVIQLRQSSASALDNGVIGDPKVDCMEDRVKLTFRTERPFNGRIFVKGMIENDKCVRTYHSNPKQSIDFQLTNGECNMRRSRKLGPEQRGVEQSITVIISFHNVFITKVDRAYRCTCFYMEADKVVTNRFDVSMLPTTDLIDTAKMPSCTYTVRRGSVNGPIVSYATVGEPVFHVWSCDSDMFAMLVHNCFVDDGAGKDRKPLIDEQGCTIDPVIVSDLTYNNQANLAYSEVNVFKFADKMVTYFQCAISTCMISEGMCKGKTPPRCGVNSRRRRHNKLVDELGNNISKIDRGKGRRDDYVMDLAAEKIVVLDLEDSSGNGEVGEVFTTPSKSDMVGAKRRSEFLNELRRDNVDDDLDSQIFMSARSLCFSYHAVTLLTGGLAFFVVIGMAIVAAFIWRQRTSTSIKIGNAKF